MCRRFTLREACNQLGLIDDLSDDDDDGEDAEFIPVEDGEDDEEVVEDDGEVAVDDEGDIEAFEERDDNDTDDDEASSDEAANSDHSDGEGRAFDCIPNKSGISHTTQEIPNLYDVEISLHNDPELLLPLKLKSKVLSICSQKK